MTKCLGLFIDGNLIKYAKVAKDHDVFKIESYGVKFSDNINDSIKQIVNETYSYKIPISTNLSGEHYTYSELFSLLNQKDLNKAAKTEFEYFCNETHKNINGVEYRNLLVPNLENRDKLDRVAQTLIKKEVISADEFQELIK